ncbi:MAG: Clostripain family protease [candidate division TM6 bacterium GW2011_GWF2_37_49]|nr:MAG: Clostripain family protease [candidate division TM6 bacterium GW2011_GWF2_37_49]
MKKFLLIATILATLYCNNIYSMIPRAFWTVINYMEADNTLAEFSSVDIDEMIQGLKDAAVVTDARINVLVQLDLPKENKTWRFKIEGTGKIEDESVNQAMGADPERELVETAHWIRSKYQANHYFWILWSHGSGIEDYRKIRSSNGKIRFINSWLEIPGYPIIKASSLKKNETQEQKTCNDNASEEDDFKGILYDDSQHSCLTNQAMTSAFTQIRDILKPGDKLDIIGMDACLMAMLEIFYQLKDCFHFFVGSQQLEPSNGWDYTRLLEPLVERADAITAENLSAIAVEAFGASYAASSEQNYTQAAVDLSKVEALKTHIDAFVALVDKCAQYKPSTISKAVISARLNTSCFDNTNYIDLYSFFSEMRKLIGGLVEKINEATCSCWCNQPPAEYVDALRALLANLDAGMQLIKTQVVIRNTYGHKFIVGPDQLANGVSIYYPNPQKAATAIHRSYYQIIFAQNSSWLNFITQYRKN